mmetsp:Transcript_173850/g.557204  ORF Transcript_173850/g.557204 Transcript_173850/m.557204 type:complete len:247 (-) Transcript_173850:595-1335(-)
MRGRPSVTSMKRCVWTKVRTSFCTSRKASITLRYSCKYKCTSSTTFRQRAAIGALKCFGNRTMWCCKDGTCCCTRTRPIFRNCVNSSSFAASGSKKSTAALPLSSAAEDGSAANHRAMSRKSAFSLSSTSISRCNRRWALRFASRGGAATMRMNASCPLATARAESFQRGRSSKSVSPIMSGHEDASCSSLACKSVTKRTASRTSATSIFSSPCRLRKSCISIHRGARRCSLIKWICFKTGSCELM